MAKRKKGDISIRSKPLGVSDEVMDKLMIDKWLETNEPSVKFKDEPIPHLQQEPTLGTKTGYGGVKI